MTAFTYPEPPGRLDRLRMIADTEVELLDPDITPQRRQIVLVLLDMLGKGHVIRDAEGRFRPTSLGVAAHTDPAEAV